MADEILAKRNDPSAWMAELHPRLFRAKCGFEWWTDASRFRCDLSLDAEVENLDEDDLSRHTQLKTVLVEYIGNYFWLRSLPTSKLGHPWEQLLPEWDKYYTQKRSQQGGNVLTQPEPSKSKKRVLEDDGSAATPTKRSRAEQKPASTKAKQAKTPTKSAKVKHSPAPPVPPSADIEVLARTTVERNDLKKELNACKLECAELRKATKRKAKETEQAAEATKVAEAQVARLEARLSSIDEDMAKVRSEASQRVEASEGEAKAAILRANAADGQAALLLEKVKGAESRLTLVEELRQALHSKESEVYQLYQRLGEAERALSTATAASESDKFAVKLLEAKLGQFEVQAERETVQRLRETREEVSRLSSNFEQRLAAMESRLTTKFEGLGSLTVNALLKASSTTHQSVPAYNPTPQYPPMQPPFYSYSGTAPAPLPSSSSAPDDDLRRAMHDFLQRKDNQ